MKELLRKYPLLFILLKKLYRGVIHPIQSGYAFGHSYYLFAIKKREVKKLSNLEFQNVCEFKPDTWRYGKGKDNAYRRYYTATFEGKKCFIKVATKNDSTVSNEIDVQEYIQGRYWKFTPACLMTQRVFDKGIVMLANEYRLGLRPFVLPLTLDAFEKMCDCFCIIADSLYEAGLVHADVHRGNLLMDDAGSLVLLDFGISYILSKGNQVDYVARPGTFFRDSGQSRLYDDIYSFIRVLEKEGLPEEWKQNAHYLNVMGRMGRCSIIIKLSP